MQCNKKAETTNSANTHCTALALFENYTLKQYDT